MGEIKIIRPRDQGVFKTPKQRVEESLARLEGSIEGIKVFYPSVGQYMMDQVDTLYRILVLPGSQDTILEYLSGEPSKASKAGQPERKLGRKNPKRKK